MWTHYEPVRPLRGLISRLREPAVDGQAWMPLSQTAENTLRTG